jgi:nucleoside-diphosphate-sugar epimerase
MRVFVAGATGILGRCTLPLLRAAGHEVVGVGRKDVDIYDADAVARMADGCGAVLHLATSIPTGLRTGPADWAENDRLRTDGVRSLVKAARAVGAKTYVQQSVTFVYGDRQGAEVDEDAPVNPTATIRTALQAEALALEAQGALGVHVLRGGWFAHPHAAHTQRLVADLRGWRMAVVGPGDNWMAIVHVDDMALAVLRAVETPGTGGTYNICVEPVTQRVLYGMIATAVGASSAWTVPAFVARAALGAELTGFVTASARVKSERARQALGWAPRFPDATAIAADIAARVDSPA